MHFCEAGIRHFAAASLVTDPSFEGDILIRARTLAIVLAGAGMIDRSWAGQPVLSGAAAAPPVSQSAHNSRLFGAGVKQEFVSVTKSSMAFLERRHGTLRARVGIFHKVKFRTFLYRSNTNK